MLVHVKKKAQITLPLKVREAVGVMEGDMLDVTIKDNEIILTPVIKGRIKLKLVGMDILDKMTGAFSIGGDAVKDTEGLYK